MGNFFTSICMKTSRTAAKTALQSVMKSRGYRTDNKTPDISFTLIPIGNNWCCLKGAQMDFDDFQYFAATLSSQLNAPILVVDCVDSDFLYLTLHRKGETNIACVGEPYDEEPPIPDQRFWQDLTGNFDTFMSILTQDRTFAEEALLPLGEIMGFEGEALLPSNESAEKAFTVGFSRSGANIAALITSGPTKLGKQFGFGSTPYHMDNNSSATIHNYGGPSKGLEIIIDAAFPDHRDLPFEIYNTHIRDLKNQIHGIGASPQYAEFECIFREPAHSIWHAVFPDFQIPEGINPDYKYSSLKEERNIIFERSIVFNYRLRIPEHLRSLNINFIPLEYPEGSFTWRLEDCWITPQGQEIFDRKGSEAFQKYLKENNL